MHGVTRKLICPSRVRMLLVASLLATTAGCASTDAPLLATVKANHRVSDEIATSNTAGSDIEQPLPDLPDEADLATYLRYAELNHPALRAAGLRWEAALEQPSQERSLPDPSLNVGYESMDRETRVGVSQMFPFPGKQALRGSVAAAGTRVARQQIEVTRREVLQRVADAYAEYAYVARAQQLIAQNVELARQLEQVTMARVRGGGPQADLIRAQIELARLEDELRSTRELLHPSAARLNAALGRPTDAHLPQPPDGEGVANDAVPSDAQLLARLREASPALAVLREEAEQSRQAMALARREPYPDFTIGLDYMRDPMDSGIGVMFSMTVPIWQQRNRAAIRQANYSFLAANQALVERRIHLEADLHLAIHHLRDAERQIALYSERLLPHARQALASTEAAYRAGEEDFLALSEAYRLPLDFELALARARADRTKALAEIDMLIGGFTQPTAEDNDHDN